MTTNLHDKMLAAIDAYFSASRLAERDQAEEQLLDVRDELLKRKRAEQSAQQEPVAKVCHDLAGHIGWNPKLMELPDEGAFLYTTPQAQQVPLTDIYRSFEQWKNGNVLEHGMPRTEYYSEQELSLVEMGWKYGYDAGLAEQPAQQVPTIYVDPDAIRILLDPDHSGVVTAQLTRHKPDPLRGPKVGLSITKGNT